MMRETRPTQPVPAALGLLVMSLGELLGPDDGVLDAAPDPTASPGSHSASVVRVMMSTESDEDRDLVAVWV